MEIRVYFLLVSKKKLDVLDKLLALDRSMDSSSCHLAENDRQHGALELMPLLSTCQTVPPDAKTKAETTSDVH